MKKMIEQKANDVMRSIKNMHVQLKEIKEMLDSYNIYSEDLKREYMNKTLYSKIQHYTDLQKNITIKMQEYNNLLHEALNVETKKGQLNRVVENYVYDFNVFAENYIQKYFDYTDSLNGFFRNGKKENSQSLINAAEALIGENQLRFLNESIKNFDMVLDSSLSFNGNIYETKKTISPEDYIMTQKQIREIKKVTNLMSQWRMDNLRGENTVEKEKELGIKLSQIDLDYKLYNEYDLQKKNNLSDDQKEIFDKFVRNNEIIFEDFAKIRGSFQEFVTYTGIEENSYSREIYSQKTDDFYRDIMQKAKEIIKNSESIINNYHKAAENNKQENIKEESSQKSELHDEMIELEEMMKEVVSVAPSSIRNSWFDFARKNYNVLASKCTKEDYAKVLGTYFEKAEDIVTKPSKITEEDLKTLGIYYGLTRIDKSQVGKNVVVENNAEKVIEMLENSTKKKNVQQK